LRADDAVGTEVLRVLKPLGIDAAVKALAAQTSETSASLLPPSTEPFIHDTTDLRRVHAAQAHGNKGDRRGNTSSMRFPGNVAICSHRFLTIGRIRVGERRQHGSGIAPPLPEHPTCAT
jgi:hypothetical protein